MEIFQQDLTATIMWLIPQVSLVLNVALIGILIYLIQKSPNNEGGKTTDQKIASVYKEAEFEASELMKDASEKAKRIIQEAGIIKDTLDNRLEKSLEQMNEMLNQKILAKEEEIYAQFKKVFDTIAQSYQSEGASIVKNFKEDGETMIKTYIQTMHAEINSVREQIFQNLDQKMTLIDEDLQKYRDEQQKRIEQNLNKITRSTIESYMRDALAYENQEKIMFKVLEKFGQDTATSSAK